MGLEESCQAYLGSLVVVKPVYGWGWSRLDAPEIPVPAEVDGVPRPFHCRIRDFFYFRDELRGATGRVEESGHVYDGLWVVFSTRMAGTYEFTDNPPYCDVQIGSDTPVGEWPEFTSGSPIVNGFGYVGKSLRRIEENNARIFTTS